MRTTVITAVCLVFLAGASAQQRKKAPPATPSAKHILEAYVSAWNRHDFAAFDTLLAPDAIHEDIAWPFRGRGPAQIKEFMRVMIQGQPDLNWHLTTVVEAGRLVAAEWTWTSTFTGNTPSGPVVRKRISARGASVAVIENGRIKRFSDYYDFASAFRETPASIGAVDHPSQEGIANSSLH